MKNRSKNDKYVRSRKQAAKDAEKRQEQEKLEKYQNAIVSDAFLKVKRKFTAEAIVKSAICGVSFGLFAVGLLLLIIKLNGIAFGIVWYIVAGVACALLCGGITFLFLKPNNRRVARTVDEEFGLKEQVQTSLAFSRSSGDVVVMQRERAEAAIGALPRRKPKFSKIWQYIVIAVLALALAVAGILVPGKEIKGSAGTGGEPGVSVDRTHIMKVQELIDYIKYQNERREDEQTKKDNGDGGEPERYISQKLADSVVAELEGFLELLEDSLERDVEVVPGQVLPVLQKINSIISAETNYIQIAEIITESENGAETEGGLGDIVRAGGDAYRTEIFLTEDEINDYHKDMEDKATNAVNRKTADLFNWLIPADPAEENGGEQTPSGSVDENGNPAAPAKSDEERLADAIARIEQVKTLVEGIKPNLETFYGLIVGLCPKLEDENLQLPNKEITACFEALESYLFTLIEDADKASAAIPESSKHKTDDDAKSAADAAEEAQKEAEKVYTDFKQKISDRFTDFFTLLCSGGQGISETLGKQSYYMALDRHISNKIRNAFHMELIQPDKIENEGGDRPGGSGNSGNPNQGSTNPNASGKNKFPGDEWVYDHRSETVEFYGDIVGDYRQMMEEFLSEHGELTEKQKQMIQAYFDALQSESAD